MDVKFENGPLIALMVLLSATGVLAQEGGHFVPASANPGFRFLQSLEGEWSATFKRPPQPGLPSASMVTVRSTYRIISGGSALMETMRMGDAQPMVTIYYCDGDDVMATHYCSSNTQPRLRASTRTLPARSLMFEFVDASNLVNSSQMNIGRLEMKRPDEDHLVQTWHQRGAGRSPILLPLVRIPKGAPEPAAVGPPSTPMTTPMPPENFTRIRSLEGRWTGQGSEGGRKPTAAEITYDVISGGTAVMETLAFEKEAPMVTIYCVDGDQVLATHYCLSNTQPRLRTKKTAVPTAPINLDFVDCTNVINATMMNVSRLTLETPGPGKLRQTWRSDTRAPGAMVIDLTRVATSPRK